MIDRLAQLLRRSSIAHQEFHVQIAILQQTRLRSCIITIFMGFTDVYALVVSTHLALLLFDQLGRRGLDRCRRCFEVGHGACHPNWCRARNRMPRRRRFVCRSLTAIFLPSKLEYNFLFTFQININKIILKKLTGWLDRSTCLDWICSRGPLSVSTIMRRQS